MAKRALPQVIERYVYVRLLGKNECGGMGDATANDPWELVEPPLKGLFDSRIGQLDDAADYLRSMRSLELRCDHCGRAALHIHPDDQDIYSEYAKMRLRHLENAESLAREIALLQRFIEPELMGEVYEILETELPDSEQWIAFVEAARNARMNFSEFRKIQKKAEKMIGQVAESSRQLALLLRQLQATGVRLPVELQSHTKEANEWFISTNSQESNRLGLLRFIERMSARGAATTDRHFDLKTLLFKVSGVAKNLSVEFASPEIDAAISSRQDSKKTAYLRAFGALLIGSGIEPSPRVKRAMAITANVIMDDAELSISEDDVRKALGRAKARQSGKEKG